VRVTRWTAGRDVATERPDVDLDLDVDVYLDGDLDLNLGAPTVDVLTPSS
jgi:hypothetical protein